MTDQTMFVPGHEVPALPSVREIRVADVREALAAGFDDFWTMPTHVVFLAIIYPVIGLVLARVTTQQHLLPLVYPLIAGFALLGPFAAIGLYELSRRREQGLDVSWKHAFDVLRSPSIGSIAALGLALMVIFLAWLAVAHAIYIALMGRGMPASMTELLHRILTTPSGWALIILGNGVGLLFAIVALAVGVVSFPLLLDRNVGANAAILTSVRAVLKNPVPMGLWGLIVALALLIGSVPFLIGLAVVMPILGHATWHLYRRVVQPAAEMQR